MVVRETPPGWTAHRHGRMQSFGPGGDSGPRDARVTQFTQSVPITRDTNVHQAGTGVAKRGGPAVEGSRPDARMGQRRIPDRAERQVRAGWASPPPGAASSACALPSTPVRSSAHTRGRCSVFRLRARTHAGSVFGGPALHRCQARDGCSASASRSCVIRVRRRASQVSNRRRRRSPRRFPRPAIRSCSHEALT